MCIYICSVSLEKASTQEHFQALFPRPGKPVEGLGALPHACSLSLAFSEPQISWASTPGCPGLPGSGSGQWRAPGRRGPQSGRVASLPATEGAWGPPSAFKGDGLVTCCSNTHEERSGEGRTWSAVFGEPASGRTGTMRVQPREGRVRVPISSVPSLPARRPLLESWPCPLTGPDPPSLGFSRWSLR